LAFDRKLGFNAFQWFRIRAARHPLDGHASGLVIGHVKVGHRVGGNYLKGRYGDPHQRRTRRRL
jgi:hypothetical protein